MTVFYTALVLGLAVGVVYVALTLDAFRRVRGHTLAVADGRLVEDATDADDVYAAQGRHFAWKATGGVVASSLILAAISVSPAAWYLVPFLAIGSSIAVVAAFLLDRRP